IDAPGGVMQNLFISKFTDPNTNTVNLSNIDLTAFAGKTIRVRVATTNNQGLLIVGVDNLVVSAVYDDTTPPTVSNLALRNPGFLDPTTGLVQHTTDPTIVGQVGALGGVNNVSFIAFDPDHTGFTGP